MNVEYCNGCHNLIQDKDGNLACELCKEVFEDIKRCPEGEQNAK